MDNLRKSLDDLAGPIDVTDGSFFLGTGAVFKARLICNWEVLRTW